MSTGVPRRARDMTRTAPVQPVAVIAAWAIHCEGGSAVVAAVAVAVAVVVEQVEVGAETAAVTTAIATTSSYTLACTVRHRARTETFLLSTSYNNPLDRCRDAEMGKGLILIDPARRLFSGLPYQVAPIAHGTSTNAPSTSRATEIFSGSCKICHRPVDAPPKLHPSPIDTPSMAHRKLHRQSIQTYRSVRNVLRNYSPVPFYSSVLHSLT